MSSAILNGISNSNIQGILCVNFILTDDNNVSRAWNDQIFASGAEEAQLIITERISEYFAEIARQDAIWTAASGNFTRINPITQQEEQYYIAKEDYIKPVAYWDVIRAKRNELLTASDWTQLSDAPLDSSEKGDWAAYRQQLRDIPSNYISDITSVVWPTQP